ncbi:MAG: LytTR family transcriptional regulator DNA-binding domain-containing protein [Saprospiraceae bacterium]|nr:LytTR family transcriptional regulator DNA-binding domain-containing protein [Saprospiraceae bacterium]
MLNAILIDDEPECLLSLAYDLDKHCPDVRIIEQCQGGKEGVVAINKHQPDVVFLDIDMPFVNGFDLLEMVPNIDFEVVFTTAYDKYALQAFKISAVDFLLKPIDPESLKQAVQKVLLLKERGNAQKQINFLIQQIKDLENNNVRKIALPTFEGLEFIDLDDILYCQSDSAYSYVFFTDGTKLYISKTLRYLEEILCDFHFFRVHNSYIVNLHYVRKYSKADGGLLIMNNGDKVRVSRSKKEELLNLF